MTPPPDRETQPGPSPLAGPCVCDSRYDGCDHANLCGQTNDGSGRGPWCAECNPRRLDAIRESLTNLRKDFAHAARAEAVSVDGE